MEQPDAAPDLVGRTSARLLAAGVERRERLAALHLLAILDASIDMNGRVRRPLDDLAAEFELTPISVIRSLDHLERAGAVQRDGSAVILLGNNPDGLGGMQLADFIEDVRASFEHEDVVPIRRSPWLVRSSAALVAAAAAVAVFTLAPATQPAVEQPLQVAGSATPTSTQTTDVPTTAPSAAPTTQSTNEPTTTLAPGLLPDTTVLAAVSCPKGEPVATVVGGLIEIANPTDRDLVVTGISLGGTILDGAIEIAAGESVTRDLAPGASVVGPAIDSWEWSEEPVARSCPS